jgi:hypothetical protein
MYGCGLTRMVAADADFAEPALEPMIRFHLEQRKESEPVEHSGPPLDGVRAPERELSKLPLLNQNTSRNSKLKFTWLTEIGRPLVDSCGGLCGRMARRGIPYRNTTVLHLRTAWARREVAGEVEEGRKARLAVRSTDAETERPFAFPLHIVFLTSTYECDGHMEASRGGARHLTTRPRMIVEMQEIRVRGQSLAVVCRHGPVASAK